MVKTLPGQELTRKDYAELLKRVDAVLWALIYKPVVDLVRPTLPKPAAALIAPRNLRDATPRELHNAAEDEGRAALLRGLKDGSVQMVPDHTGKRALFAVVRPDRRVSDGLKSFGCVLNKTTGYWACASAQVPAWALLEADSYASKARLNHEAVFQVIDDLEQNLDHLVDEQNLEKASDHAVSEVTRGWKERAKALEIMPDLGPVGMASLSQQFARTRDIPIKSPGKVGMVDAVDLSTKKAIKVWGHEALERLRTQVEKNALQGYRAEGMAQRIRDEFGVSKSRADLIARQEVDNFMAAYHAATAADAGLSRYVWTCVRDSRTRQAHKDLNGRIFSFANPPITDPRTSARNNPGQDFRCRCRARILIE